MDLTFLQKLNKEASENFELLQPIQEINPDGSLHRFDSTKPGDKAIWVCIHANDYKGNLYYNAVYGNWRAGVQYTCSSYEKGDKETQSKEFKASEKKQLKETQERLDQEKQMKYKACRDKWTPYYYSLPVQTPLHDYLRAKKLKDNYHGRVDRYGVLIVPAWNAEGILTGVQRIFLDPETNKWEKRFVFGIEIKGSFCPFGDVRNAEIIYICEGFATAASVYQAFKVQGNVAVVCVWNTSNLLEGAQAIRKINPNSYLVFAADKDTNSDPKLHNIGEKKAKQAANKLSNAIVKTVKFSVANDKWTDYNDLHQFEGLDHVIKQLFTDSTEFTEIIPLGFNGKKYHYFSTSKKDILDLSASDHNPGNLSMEAPAKYWGDRYGYILDKEGNKTKNPNWKMVIEKLGTESAKVGRFNPSKVRGVGAWEENGKMLVNIGDKIYYNGEFFPLFNNGIESNYFYQSSESVSLDFNRPLPDDYANKFVEAFKMLRYKNPSDYIILLGWIFSAQIFAALPWRPHIWITGERGSGKSTILNYINEALAFSVLTQGSTASGIRQRILNNAFPIISDEAEPNNEKDRMKLQEVLELARQSSTRSSYETLRGSASGKSVSYNTNTCFCMGSIQLSSMGGADTSRFFVIEMETVKEQSHAEFIRLENAMNEVTDLASGLFIRAVNMYENHIKNIELAKKVIKERKIESRQADQLAPIIAGYFAYFSTDLMDETFVVNTIRELNFETSEYAQANEVNDSEKCFEDLLGLQIPGQSITVGQILEKIPYETNGAVIDGFNHQLGLFGLRYMDFEKALFIPGRSSVLKKAIEKISDYSDYGNTLKRHSRYVETKPVRVAGSLRKGHLISLD
jgi:phage/plasmid primase-like uncharacterized protein